ILCKKLSFAKSFFSFQEIRRKISTRYRFSEFDVEILGANMVNLVSLCYLVAFIALGETSKPNQWHGVFWEVEPYIKYNSSLGIYEGIFPTIFLKAISYCNISQNRILSYDVNLKSRNEFQKALESKTLKGDGILANISSSNAAAWFPHDVDKIKKGPFAFLRRNLTVMVGVSSEGLAVIQPRSRIWLPNKILQGIPYCYTIIIIAVMFAVYAGLLLWVFERSSNDNFKTSGGPMLGLYWSFVTMTTVGYGDIVAVSFFGRVLSVIWMFVGLIMAAILTATLTNVVTGTEGLSIEGQEVAVVRDSHEERYVQLDYFAKPKLYDTYDDVIDAVREEKVYAAVLPHDVATWRQHDIRNPNVKNPLAITGELDGQVPFDFLVHKDAFPKSEEIMDCIFSKYKYEIITSTMDMYKRRLIIETLYYGNADQIFEDNLPVQIGIGLAVAALFVSLLITLYNRSHQKTSISVREKKEKIEAVFDEMLVLMRDYREFVKVKDGVLDLKDEIKINIEKTG
uniref:Potassium channel domain-containing protein n=1 Tax=Clytia hemisphaerica TaxID=252671 RepID=A0A7M5V5Q6_9CNID